MRKKLIIISSAAVLLILAAVFAWWKFTSTPEYRIMTGDSFEKRQVIKFLHKVEPWRSRRMLRKLINDPDPQVRILAVGCIGRHGYSDLYPLAEHSARQDEDVMVRAQALIACAMGQSEHAGELISDGLKSREPEIRTACFHSAEFGIQLTPADITAGLKDPDARIRDAALEAAVSLKTAEAVPILAADLNNEEYFTLQQNLNALQEITGINRGLDEQAWNEWYGRHKN